MPKKTRVEPGTDIYLEELLAIHAATQHWIEDDHGQHLELAFDAIAQEIAGYLRREHGHD